MDYVEKNKDAYILLAKNAAIHHRDFIREDVEKYGTAFDKTLGKELGVIAYQRKVFPPRSDLHTTSPNNVIYNEAFEMHLYSSLFIQYLVEKKIIDPVKMNNSLEDFGSLRFVTGVTALYLFEGHAMLSEPEYGNDLRSSVDLKEFNEWIVSPLKKYSADELSQYPVMKEMMKTLQDNYIKAIKQLSYVNPDALSETKSFPGWFPLQRKELEKISASF